MIKIQFSVARNTKGDVKMANTVDFKNTSGQAQYVTLGSFTEDALSKITPIAFDNDYDGHATLSLADIIGMIFPGGDVSKKPYFYIRHMDMKKHQIRFGNIVELGDNFLSPQKGVYREKDVAQAGTAISAINPKPNNAHDYAFGSEQPYSRFTFGSDYYTAKEGNFFSLKGEYWPNTIIEHRSMYRNVSTYIQAATHSGVFEDKLFVGLGEHDRLFIPKKVNGFDAITNNFGYFYLNLMGIREDGRREQALISIDNSGKNLAYYFIDGAIPIISDHVSMEADWYHLPYVNDGTCIYKDAIFRFCGKEFHFQGKWGSKGFTPNPRIEKHGQSQIFGTWYEGARPYKHKIYMTLGENMEAYDYKLEQMGFKVVN